MLHSAVLVSAMRYQLPSGPSLTQRPLLPSHLAIRSPAIFQWPLGSAALVGPGWPRPALAYSVLPTRTATSVAVIAHSAVLVSVMFSR